ncbi:MAG: hypothetical protein JJU11_03520 [Candidatus Sumerlaeia bacterium]|nr:hypothetical protein [Candidatus Sumerlaeia bacterium]
MKFRQVPPQWLLLAAIALVLSFAGPSRASLLDLAAHEIQKRGVIETISQEEHHSRLRFSMDDFARYKLPNRAPYHFWLVSVPGNTPRIEMVSATWWAVEEDGTRHGPFEIDEGEQWGPLPESVRRVRVTHVGSFRGFGMNRSDFNAVHNSTRVESGTRIPFRILIQNAEFDVNIRGNESRSLPTELSLEQYDPYGLNMIQMMAANASQAEYAYRKPDPIERKDELEKWSDMLLEAADREMLWFSRLPRPGVYRIDAETLRRFDIDPTEFPVNELRFFVGGNEVPVMVENLRGGLLLGDASIVFYAHQELDARKPFIPFWIMHVDGDEPPRRGEIHHVGGRVGDNEALEGTTKIEIFEPNVYHHTLPLHGPNLKWATAMVAPRDFHEMEFEVARVLEEGNSELRVWLSNRDPRATTEFAVFINGREVHTGSTRGVRIQEEVTQIPNRLLREGTNTIAFLNRETADPVHQSPIFFLNARLRLATDSFGLLPHQTLQVNRPANTSVGLVLPALGDTNRDGFLMDVTDPFNPVYSRFNQTRHEGRPGFVSVTSSTHRNPRYIYSHGNTMYRLTDLEPFRAPRSFVDNDPLDYLVVFHKSLEEEVVRLLGHRRHTRSVAAYRVCDIYAIFSYGEVSYEAIHEFTRHAFEHRDGARFQELLLIGEGSEYWWEKTHWRDDVTENLVPIYGWADPTVRIRGDDSYSQIVGDGPLSDIEVGRISVNDNEELRIVIDKIMNYEINPPRGPWLSRHLFVTDEQPEFDRVVGEIIDKSLEGANFPRYFSLNQFPYEDYFRGFWRKRSSVMTDRLLDAWNQGARTITYMGHGGPNLWSSNRIMHLRDVDHLDVQGRFPFMVAGSCDTGWVDYPVDPVRASLAEEFLRSEKGGVIAAYIPIDGTSSYEHNFLLTALFQAKFQHGIDDVGTLSLMSKVNYHLHRNNPSVTNQYLLMGDPATRLAPQPREMPMEADPGFLLTKTDGSITVTGTPWDMEWGTVKLELFDSSSQSVSKTRARVTDGQFTTSLEIPQTLDRGLYRLVAFATSEGQGYDYVATTHIPVLDATMHLSWDSSVEDNALLPAGTQIAVTLNIENRSDVDLNGAVLQVRAMEGNTEISRGAVSVASGENFSQVFRPRLPSGLYTLEGRLFASVADLEADRDPLASGFMRMRGASPDVPILALSVADVTFNRVTTDGNTEVNVRLYNMTRQTVEGHRLVLRRLVDEETAVALMDQIPLPTVPPETARDVTLPLASVLAPGEMAFALDVLAPIRQEDDDGELQTVYTRAQRIPFVKEVPIGPDLKIVDGSLVLEDERPLAGLTTYARFTVRNAGDVPIERVRGRLYLDAPLVADNEAHNAVPWASRNEIPRLDPGEEHVFRLRWDPFMGDPTETVLYAVVDSAANTGDIIPGNNIASRPISLRRPPNLALLSDKVEISHTLLRPRDRVSVSVPYANVSDLDFVRTFRITGHAVASNGARTRLFNNTVDSLLAGESGSLQFEWFVQPGQNSLMIDLNEDREYMESTYSDNVLQFTFPYVVESDWFSDPGKVWDFTDFEELGILNGLMSVPSGGLTPLSIPRSSVVSHDFRENYLIDGPVGDYLDVDNRWGLYRESLFLSYDESAAPVTFRFPLNRGYHTNLYDLYINHIGNRYPERKSGHFRYRLAGQEDFTLHEPATHGEEYLGRFRLRDQHLEITIDAPPYPSFNQLMFLEARPVEGVYTSPVVMSTRMPRGEMIVETLEPEETSVEFQVRYGSGSTREVAWGDWEYVRRGELLPVSPADTLFFQWRAFLVMDREARPTLRSVRFEMQPQAPAGELAAGNR